MASPVPVLQDSAIAKNEVNFAVSPYFALPP